MHYELRHRSAERALADGRVEAGATLHLQSDNVRFPDASDASGFEEFALSVRRPGGGGELVDVHREFVLPT